MSADDFKIDLTYVFPEYEGIYPPIQPQEADSQLTLANCRGWVLLWPKTQIRVGKHPVQQKTSQPITNAARPSLLGLSQPRMNMNEEQIPHDQGDHINQFFMDPPTKEYENFLDLDGAVPPCQKSLFTEDFTPPELENMVPHPPGTH